ncbi:outer membrane lipoprotein-sorting protein [Bacteroidota bacterium]
MKTIIVTGWIIILSFSICIGQDLSGEEIIKKVDDIINVETAWAKSKMTIITSSGDKRTFVSESWSKNKGEKNLVRYISPRRVKGQAILMLNNADDIWSFFPRTQRVRKLATHAKKQKMQGSDFSYEDMGSGDSFINDYTPNRLEDEEMEGVECFKLELIRKKDSDLSYSHLIMWIIKESFIPIVIDYYDEDDPKLWLKRLIQSNIKIIDNTPTAMKSIMYNQLDKTQTEMELLEVKYNIQLEDEMFTERNLKK